MSEMETHTVHYVVTNTEVCPCFFSLNNKRDRFETLMQHAEWFQFTVDYYFR